MKKKEIIKHYKEEADKYGNTKFCTHDDEVVKDKEVERILRLIRKETNVLEIGCGNGYLAEQIIRNKNVNYTGIDVSQDMIELCNQRNLGLEFICGDFVNYPIKERRFDTIVSERCLINLENWEEQKRGIIKLKDLLTTRGDIIAIECFEDAWNYMNNTRKEIDLNIIPKAIHNVYLKEKDLFPFLEKEGLTIEKFDPFLSSYFFGSRIIYPALKQGKNIQFNTNFVQFFKDMQNVGNYSPIKLLHLNLKNGVYEKKHYRGY